MITTILFDLDGTLLPMDQDAFVRLYIGLLCRYFAPHGYDPKQLSDGLMLGIKVMYKNDGSCTNEEAFWKRFTGIYGEQVLEHKPYFDEFYRVEFQQAKGCCGFDAAAAPLVRRLKEKGLRVALATNPLFPAAATHSRIRWAGMEPEDFELVTTYENARFCKPNPAYYEEILSRLGVTAQECLMVGNDVDEDMIAGNLGMKVFLLTPCLINKKGKDISVYPNGGFDALSAYLETL